jgi:hypothetical protein
MLLALLLTLAPLDESLQGAALRPLSTKAVTKVELTPTWFLHPTMTTKTNGVLEVSEEGARLFATPIVEGAIAGVACQVTSKTPLAYSRLRLASPPWLVDGKAVTYAPVQAKPERVVLTPFLSNVANKDPILEAMFATVTLGASLVRLIPDQARDVTVDFSGPPPWRGASNGLEASCRPVSRVQVDAVATEVSAGLDRCTELRCVARGAALLGPWDSRVEAAARRVNGDLEARVAERFATAGHQPVSVTVLDTKRCGPRCAALVVRNDLPVTVDFDISGAVDRAGNSFFVGGRTELAPSSTTVVRSDVPGEVAISWPLLLDVNEETVTLAIPSQRQVRDWYVAFGAPTWAAGRWELPAEVEAFGGMGPTSLDVLWRTGVPQFTDGWADLMKGGAPASVRRATLRFPPVDGVGNAPPLAARLRVPLRTLGFVVP